MIVIVSLSDAWSSCCHSTIHALHAVDLLCIRQMLRCDAVLHGDHMYHSLSTLCEARARHAIGLKLACVWYAIVHYTTGIASTDVHLVITRSPSILKERLLSSCVYWQTSWWWCRETSSLDSAVALLLVVITDECHSSFIGSFYRQPSWSRH
jgi:hypothetical protein